MHELLANGKVDIKDPTVLDAMNSGIAEATSASALTPYIAWAKVQKVLAVYHIHLPNPFLDGERGNEVIPVSQFGEKFGQTDDGRIVTNNESGFFLYFEWMKNVFGEYTIFAEVVNEKDLNELVNDFNEENLNEDYKKELAMGSKDEAEEHGMSKKQAIQTAKDHLKKDKKYYSKLKSVGLEEDMENITEVSKKLLKSYIKKAAHDVATKSAAVGRYADRANRVRDEIKKGDYGNYQQGKKDDEFADKMFKKSWKRRKNIEKAVDKLEEGDTQLDERAKWRQGKEANPNSVNPRNDVLKSVPGKKMRSGIRTWLADGNKKTPVQGHANEPDRKGKMAGPRKGAVLPEETALNELHGKGSLEKIKKFHDSRKKKTDSNIDKIMNGKEPYPRKVGAGLEGEYDKSVVHKAHSDRAYSLMRKRDKKHDIKEETINEVSTDKLKKYVRKAQSEMPKTIQKGSKEHKRWSNVQKAQDKIYKKLSNGGYLTGTQKSNPLNEVTKGLVKRYIEKAVNKLEEASRAVPATKKSVKGTKWKVISRNPDSEGSEVEVRQGKRRKMTGYFDRNSNDFHMSKTKKGKIDMKDRGKSYDTAKDMLKNMKEETVNEVSKVLLKKYIEKANPDHERADLSYHYTGNEKSMAKRNRRGKGLMVARRKTNQAYSWDSGKAKVLAKEETLNEISKKVLKSYVKKASVEADPFHKKSLWWKTKHFDSKTANKISNRETGIKRAENRLSRTSLVKKKYGLKEATLGGEKYKGKPNPNNTVTKKSTEKLLKTQKKAYLMPDAESSHDKKRMLQKGFAAYKVAMQKKTVKEANEPFDPPFVQKGKEKSNPDRRADTLSHKALKAVKKKLNKDKAKKKNLDEVSYQLARNSYEKAKKKGDWKKMDRFKKYSEKKDSLQARYDDLEYKGD